MAYRVYVWYTYMDQNGNYNKQMVGYFAGGEIYVMQRCKIKQKKTKLFQIFSDYIFLFSVSAMPYSNG